jgi:small subunit ribosomal protein S13
MKIIGVNIPDKERVKYGLTSIYGIGRNNADDLIEKAGIDGDKRVKNLTKEEASKIIKALESYQVEGDLRKQVKDNIERLKKIRSYRGIRHIIGLPAHGQRTKTNARTVKGPAKTVGALKKEDWSKMEEQQRKAGGEK